MKAIVTITVGEREQVVEIKDARSLGFLANGAASQLESMHDGHGNLVHPEESVFAEDLTEFGKAARAGWSSATSS